MALLKLLLRPFKNLARSVIYGIPAWFRFWQSYFAYGRMCSNDKPRMKHLMPFISDATPYTPGDAVYFYQDAWAFEKVVQNKPARHVDVGSDQNYVALLSKVLPVTMVDIRPLRTPMDSLTFQKGSILALPFDDNSVPSVSSICVIEHIGLGRYGDDLDPDGSAKAIAELKRIVEPGGSLLVSLPLEDQNTTYFNAHRTFREDYLFSLFSPFEIIERRYIYGIEFVTTPRSGFGVGCYWLKKPGYIQPER